MKDLKKLFSVLVCYRHNMHILHWKVVGHNFDSLHELFEGYTNKLGTFIDEIGEILMSENENPLNLIECVEILEKDDDHFLSLNANEDYDFDEAFKALNIMFKTLSELYSELIEDDDISSDIASKLDEHRYWIRIENGYKNKKRMIK